MSSILRPRVVVVEDHAALKELIRDVLVTDGWTVTAFGSAHAALELATHTRDRFIALVDLMLPDGSGVEVVRTLARQGAVIAFSGSGPRVLAAASEAGALRVLKKPIAVDELLAAVREAAVVLAERKR